MGKDQDLTFTVTFTVNLRPAHTTSTPTFKNDPPVFMYFQVAAAVKKRGKPLPKSNGVSSIFPILFLSFSFYLLYILHICLDFTMLEIFSNHSMDEREAL